MIGHIKNLILKEKYRSRLFLAISFIAIVVISVDLLISNLSFDINVNNLSSHIIFFVESLIFALLQYLLYWIAVKFDAERMKTRLISFINRITMVLMSLSMIILFWIILQMIFYDNYLTISLTLALITTYSLSIIITIFLAYRFLTWYRYNKSFVVLLYGLSAVVISVRILVVATFYISLLISIPSERNGNSEVAILEFESASTLGVLNSMFTISHSMSFIMLWLTSSILLYNYYRNSKKLKFWLVVVLIPAYAISDYFISDVVIAQSIGFDPIHYDIFISFQGVAAGILMSIPFWLMSKSIKDKNSNLRSYLIISGIGIIIFFIAGSGLVDHGPFPPFGIITLISTGLSLFLIFIGIYASATIISFDTALRQYIKRYVSNQADLLYDLGIAEFERQIQKEVQKQIDKINEKEVAVSSSMSDQEMNDYIKEVIMELEKNRKSPGR